MKYISNRLSCLSPLVLIASLPRAFPLDSDAWICESSNGETCDYGRNSVKIYDGRVFCSKGDEPLTSDGAYIDNIPIGWFMDKCDTFVSSVCYFKYAESAVYDCAGFSIQVKLLEAYGANITNNHGGLDDMDLSNLHEHAQSRVVSFGQRLG